MRMPPEVGGARRPPLALGSAEEQIARCCHLTPGSVSGLNQVTWILLLGARSSPQKLGLSHPHQLCHPSFRGLEMS